MEREPRIRFSVSYTTRKPRPNEIPGRDYHFVSMERFRRDGGRAASFWSMRRFSTTATAPACSAVQEALANGEQLLLEIDWQGARQVRARLPEARSIFILPPSRSALGAAAQGPQHRFGGGHRAAAAGRRARISAHWSEFDYVVINDRFEQALADLQAIVEDRGGLLGRAKARSGATGGGLVNP